MLSKAFRGIVFSQVRISALNTILTAIYLAVVLPVAGINLPFLKTMIAVTFLVGLLPVIGNLVTNTVIVLVSFSVSPSVALASLAFLVIIHKLEYFVNARIIGTRIRAWAWELLLAMLVMDAWFGGCWTYRRANLLRLYKGRTDDAEADLRQCARAAAANGAYGKFVAAGGSSIRAYRGSAVIVCAEFRFQPVGTFDKTIATVSAAFVANLGGCHYLVSRQSRKVLPMNSAKEGRAAA